MVSVFKITVTMTYVTQKLLALIWRTNIGVGILWIGWLGAVVGNVIVVYRNWMMVISIFARLRE